MSLLVKAREDGHHRMEWYNGQLLKMAAELANRLLPAFNSTSGVPYSRVRIFMKLLYLLCSCYSGQFETWFIATLEKATRHLYSLRWHNGILLLTKKEKLMEIKFN